jgi:hypothetical protein
MSDYQLINKDSAPCSWLRFMDKTIEGKFEGRVQNIFQKS